MSLIEKLKTDTLSARKNKAPQAAALRTILGEIDTKSKLKGTKIDDTLALNIIKSTLKGLEETIAHLDKTNRVEDLEQAKLEKDVLDRYLPQSLTETQLQSVIQIAIKNGCSQMGQVMQHLKAHHNGAYDGKLAAKIAKQELAT